MEYADRIKTKEGLRAWVNQHNKVIMFGEKSLAVIMLRYFKAFDEGDKVRGMAFPQTKSEHMIFDEFVIKPIADYLVQEDSQVIVLGRS